MKKCSSCGYENDDNSKFCADCGSKLIEPPKFCPECGTELSGIPKFCPECGFNLSIAEENERLDENFYENEYSDNDYDDYDEDNSSYDDYDRYDDSDEAYIEEISTEDKILAILDKWFPKIAHDTVRWSTQTGGTLDTPKYSQAVQNAITKLGGGKIPTCDVLGLLDSSLFHNGKAGILFSREGISFDYAFEKVTIAYNEMGDFFVKKSDLVFNEAVYLSHKDGKRYRGYISIAGISFNLPALKDCLEEIQSVL